MCSVGIDAQSINLRSHDCQGSQSAKYRQCSLAKKPQFGSSKPVRISHKGMPCYRDQSHDQQDVVEFLHLHTVLQVWGQLTKCVCCVEKGLSDVTNHLVGLVVKASASRVEEPRFESHLCQDFSRVESYQ